MVHAEPPESMGFWGLVPANFGQIIYKPIQIMHTTCTRLVHNNHFFSGAPVHVEHGGTIKVKYVYILLLQPVITN